MKDMLVCVKDKSVSTVVFNEADTQRQQKARYQKLGSGLKKSTERRN
jgi:hypothetical protein